MENRLVMTLLVRDEQEIVESNIRYHLALGIKHIIATDNGSIDNTIDILKKYQRIGSLTLIEERDQTKEIDKWVSRMARIATEHYGATHLYHGDADEFLIPTRSFGLEKNLPKQSEVFFIQRQNYFFSTSTDYNLPKASTWSVIDPIDPSTLNKTQLLYNLPFIKIGPKILTTSDFQEVSQGNHDVVVSPDSSPSKSSISSYKIAHFPFRSYIQFEKKVIQGAEAYLRGPYAQKTNYGFHLRSWYELYKKGKLEHYYHRVFSEDNLLRLERNGVLKRTHVPRRIKYANLLYKLTSFKHPKVGI